MSADLAKSKTAKINTAKLIQFYKSAKNSTRENKYIYYHERPVTALYHEQSRKKHFLYRELLKNTTFFENIYEGVIVFITSSTSVRYRNLSHPKFAVKVV